MPVFLKRLNIATAVFLLVWPLLAFGSAFMFDAPGSRDNWITVWLQHAILFAPLPVITGLVGAWLANRWQKQAACAVFTMIGFAAPLAVFVLFVLLEVLCDGQFACS